MDLHYERNAISCVSLRNSLTYTDPVDYIMREGLFYMILVVVSQTSFGLTPQHSDPRVLHT